MNHSDLLLKINGREFEEGTNTTYYFFKDGTYSWKPGLYDNVICTHPWEWQVKEGGQFWWRDPKDEHGWNRDLKKTLVKRLEEATIEKVLLGE